MNETQKPKHFLIFKIVGVVGLIAAIIGFVKVITGFGDFESNNFMIGGFMVTFGLFMGCLFLILGFQPELSKLSTKTHKYIQQENKEDLTDIANTSAEIYGQSIKQTAMNIKEGLSDTKFCRFCGNKIESDSVFCKHCGKEQ